MHSPGRRRSQVHPSKMLAQLTLATITNHITKIKMKKDGVTTKRSLRDVGAHSRPPHSWTSPGARGQPRRLAGVLEQLWSSPVVQQLPSSATRPCTFILSITDPLFYSRAPRPQVLVRWSRSTWGNFISAKLPPPFEKSARARITCFLNSSALVTDAAHWRALVICALPHAECMMMLRLQARSQN